MISFRPRNTESAGVVFAAELERETYAIFVGEPAGSPPNFFNSPSGFHVTRALPGSDIFFRTSSILEQYSDPQDCRKFVAPDISVSMSYKDYAEGRDPVMDAALGLDFESAEQYFVDEGGRPIPLNLRWRRPDQRVAFTERQWIQIKR